MYRETAIGNSILQDVVVSGILAIHVYSIVTYFSKLHYRFLSSKLGNELARYLTRKFIHIAGAGPVTILLPILFHEPFIPSLLAVIAALVLYFKQDMGSRLEWFQEESNVSEVVFGFTWAISVLSLWWLSPWAAFIPAYAMSIGDGITGYVRGVIDRKRDKTWHGTAAMMLATSVPGLLVLGAPGLTAGIVSSIAERCKRIDDNITVPAAAIAAIIITEFLQRLA